MIKLDPSLTELAIEGLTRVVADAFQDNDRRSQLPAPLLSLIVRFVIPSVAFVVNLSYVDESGTLFDEEVAREHRDQLWKVSELINLLQQQPCVRIVVQIIKQVCIPLSENNLSTLLMLLKEKTGITMSFAEIDLVRNLQRKWRGPKTTNRGQGQPGQDHEEEEQEGEEDKEWLEWRPIQLVLR